MVLTKGVGSRHAPRLPHCGQGAGKRVECGRRGQSRKGRAHIPTVPDTTLALASFVPSPFSAQAGALMTHALLVFLGETEPRRNEPRSRVPKQETEIQTRILSTPNVQVPHEAVSYI